MAEDGRIPGAAPIGKEDVQPRNPLDDLLADCDDLVVIGVQGNQLRLYTTVDWPKTKDVLALVQEGLNQGAFE